MNLKICIAIAVAFIITFGMLYSVINFSNGLEKVDHKQEFFSNQIMLNENRILLLGSSHIGHLNMTHITKNILNENPEFTIYNLAYNGDSPKLRHDDLEKIIELKPTIVFYGVSYRDFNQPTKSIDSQIWILDIKKYIDKEISEEIKNINPQLLTRKAIRGILDETGIIKKPTYDIKPPNTPFFALSDTQTQIIEKDELRRQLLIVLPTPSKIKINNNNEELEKFEEIIDRLQNENIQIIIFTTPLSRIYLDEIPEFSKKIFKDILNDLSKKKGIIIYDYEEKYADENIWNNLDHIAYNNKSLIFSDDIANMILREVNP